MPISRSGVLYLCSAGQGCSQRATCLRGSSAVEALGPQGDRCGNRHRGSSNRLPAGHASRGRYACPMVPQRARHRRDPAGVQRESRRWATTASSHTCWGRPSGTRHRRSRLDRLPSGLRRSARAHKRWTRVARPDLPISRTLRIRGTRQNASTDHLPQNVGPSRRGDGARSTHLAGRGQVSPGRATGLPHSRNPIHGSLIRSDAQFEPAGATLASREVVCPTSQLLERRFSGQGTEPLR